MAKILDYVIPHALDGAVSRTTSYFQGTSGMKVESSQSLAGEQGHVLRAKSNPTGMSWGETYVLTFRPASEKETRVHVEVSLAYGTGAQWVRPSNVLKGWALAVETTPQEFGKGTAVGVWICLIIALIISIAFLAYVMRR